MELDEILKCCFCGLKLNETTNQVGFMGLSVFSKDIKMGTIGGRNGIVHLDCLPNYVQGLYAELEVNYRKAKKEPE